jgi:hypothetical protein
MASGPSTLINWHAVMSSRIPRCSAVACCNSDHVLVARARLLFRSALTTAQQGRNAKIVPRLDVLTTDVAADRRPRPERRRAVVVGCTTWGRHH